MRVEMERGDPWMLVSQQDDVDSSEQQKRPRRQGPILILSSDLHIHISHTYTHTVSQSLVGRKIWRG